jgi:hypothetical protein
MKQRILDEATAEFADAIYRYESIESGLGVRLKQEVWSAVAWIAEHAELPRVRPKGYRRVNLRVFPFYVAYMIWDDTIWVLAIAHTARKPEYWIDRHPETD